MFWLTIIVDAHSFCMHWPWLGRYPSHCEKICIFELIQLSKHNLSYLNFNIFNVIVHLWYKQLNAFELPCGPYAPTLFDIGTLIGFKPLGQTYHMVLFPYDYFLVEHFVDDSTVHISLEEHLAFLVYW